MTRNELEELLSYDTDALSFGGAGVFFLSGASWILVEQVFGNSGFAWNSLIAICVLSLLLGAFLLWQGKRQHHKKRNRIERILDETKAPSGD